MDYRITHIKGGTDNCYIVSNGKDAILVDTSSGHSRQMVLDECSKYNMKLVVLTHPHFDHSIIVGDALDNWIIPGMGHLYYDKDLQKKTYDRIKTFGHRKVYYGHGKPTENLIIPLRGV